MATKTLGTNATTTLTAVQQPSSYAGVGLSDADIAAIANGIFNDKTTRRTWQRQIVNGAFSRNSLLYVPQRGVLKVLPGDWIGVDPTGFPILIGKHAIAGTETATGDTHTTTAVDGLSANVLNLGWAAGMIIASSNNDIPAGTHILAIAANGLSLTLSAAATGTNAGGTLTVGSWTHS